MDKIAVISDIHGNLEALQTILADIKQRNIKRIFCLGDIIFKGTHSEECVNLVRESCDVVIKGNCDSFFTKDLEIMATTEEQKRNISWTQKNLSLKSIEYLQNLPYCFEFYLSGRLVRLFHATPAQIDVLVASYDTLDSYYSMFLPSKNTLSQNRADVVIYGHLHTPFMQKIYNRILLNPGSVGNSLDLYRNPDKDGNVKNTTVANYLLISGVYNSKDWNESISYEFISVPYDIKNELTNADAIDAVYQEELENGKYRNMDRIYKNFETKGVNRDKI